MHDNKAKQENHQALEQEPDTYRKLLNEMRSAYREGRNVMEIARSLGGDFETPNNATAATLVAYDLQSGSYVKAATENPSANSQWTDQIADIIRQHLKTGDTVLEVGCGEATTLAGVVKKLMPLVSNIYGFDLAWSRINVGRKWMASKQTMANLFVGDLFSIPLPDNSIDIVYSSHSLEPNGGRERAALSECLRVARHKVILVEPLYELAQPEAQKRMQHHGYVRGLKAVSEAIGARVLRFELLPYCSNPLNPSGVIVLEKAPTNATEPTKSIQFICPLTGVPLIDLGDVYYAEEVGLAYPVLRGTPMLRPEHAVVASLLREV